MAKTSSSEVPAIDPRAPLAGRVALVTGGSRGIGAAIVERLAAEGAAVAFTFKSSEAKAAEVARRVAAAGGRALAIQADQARLDDVERAFAEVEQELGKPDIVVMNAGITRDKSLRRMTRAEWDEVLDVNLTGAFNLCRVALDHVPLSPRARIVLVSSIIGRTGGFGQVNYAASKAGLLGFARALAREVARTGATVNAICPGFIATDMVGAMPEEVLEKVVAQIPVGRLGRPEEIAHAVAFLAHPDSAFMTGAVLDVNGGHWIG